MFDHKFLIESKDRIQIALKKFKNLVLPGRRAFEVEQDHKRKNSMLGTLEKCDEIIRKLELAEARINEELDFLFKERKKNKDE